MTSKKNKRVKKSTIDQVEDDVMQPTAEASASSPGASRAASPAPSYGGVETEDEEEPVNLKTILKLLRGVGNEVKEFRQDMKTQLQGIRGELDKTSARLNEVEDRVAEQEDKLQNTDELLAEMITAQEKLQLKLTAMEAYSRRETLRLYGVPEGAESGSESMIYFVEKLLRENLNIPPSTALQIQRAHRALSPPSPSGSPPRSILIKFLCFTVKEEVLRLAWQKKGFTWNNNKVNLDHDYPPEIIAMRKEYAETRRILKDKNLRFRTLYPARLKVFFDEGVKIYNTVEEATADLASRGFPVSVIKPPATPRESLQRWATWRGARGRRPQQNRGASGYKERLQVFRREEN